MYAAAISGLGCRCLSSIFLKQQLVTFSSAAKEHSAVSCKGGVIYLWLKDL